MKRCKNCKSEFKPKRDTKGIYCSLICWLTSKDKKSLNKKVLGGKPLSKAHKEKLRNAKIGKKSSQKNIDARKGWYKRLGHKWSKATIEARRKSNKGQKRTGQAYQNLLDGVARAQGYKSYADMPKIEKPDWRGRDWKKIRKEIIKRDGNKCRECPNTTRLQVHHIVPWRISQDNSPENLETLCISCHQRKERTQQKTPLFGRSV